MPRARSQQHDTPGRRKLHAIRQFRQRLTVLLPEFEQQSAAVEPMRSDAGPTSTTNRLGQCFYRQRVPSGFEPGERVQQRSDAQSQLRADSQPHVRARSRKDLQASGRQFLLPGVPLPMLCKLTHPLRQRTDRLECDRRLDLQLQSWLVDHQPDAAVSRHPWVAERQQAEV